MPHIYLAQLRRHMVPTFVGYSPAYLEQLAATWWAIRVERQRRTRMAPLPGQYIGEWL